MTFIDWIFVGLGVLCFVGLYFLVLYSLLLEMFTGEEGPLVKLIKKDLSRKWDNWSVSKKGSKNDNGSKSK